jgi:predicted glycoside hydrolase/deacetylase ChbG (UPF0249 family)
VLRRAIIITADDLGLWPEVNDAIIAGYDAGIVSSTSLRVSAPAAHSAMVSLGMRPGLGVGLQLVLCNGKSTLPRKHIPSLVDSAGYFPEHPLEAGWLYRRRGGLRNALEAEMRAQIEKFLSSGLFMTHITSAENLHLQPTVLSILKGLAKDYPISALRKPCAEVWKGSRRYLAPGWRKSAETALMRPVMGWGRLRSGMFLGPDRVQMLSDERPVTEHAVAKRLQSAKRGITEFVCHPGSLAGIYDGSGEQAAVTSPIVRQALNDAPFEVISYRDLAEGSVWNTVIESNSATQER